MPYEMKTEEEIRKKRDEASQREEREKNNIAEKEYYNHVYSILDWVLGEGDDPFMDLDPL